jgi:hypothetical protein|tara:strand:+ start:1158 stop:1388 length:231 start_codon:yes stop_codon:yes gene_type:complete
MINLEIDIKTAASLRGALYREQNGYTLDLSCCPTRIIDIRNLILELDTKIEEQLNKLEQDKLKQEDDKLGYDTGGK